MEFLPPIQPGMTKEQFLPLLQERIETATSRLVSAGKAELAASGAAG
jgi:1-acyl-sn-glycerol-3-phosphate acyltransferase